MTLNRKTLQNFLDIAGNKLNGDWIVIGGTVLPLLGINHRVTVDIDFVSKSKKEETLKLMEIAEELGLSVETINQAGAFFLYKIPDFEKNLILLHKGKSAKIYRPNLLLYIQLKVGRLSESDSLDCLEYIKYSNNNNEVENIEKIVHLIKKEISKKPEGERLSRLKKILDSLAHAKPKGA